MEKLINVIEQVIKSEDIGAVIMGLLLIVIGILVIVFKPHWVLTGNAFWYIKNEREENYMLIFF